MSSQRLQDLRLALRRLRRDVGTTIASISALGFAIGAAVVTWSLLSTVLLKPLAVEAPDRLYQVDARTPRGETVSAYPYGIFESIRGSGAFDSIAAGGLWPMLVIDQGDATQERQVYFASHDFFRTLGIDVVRGRTFSQDDDRRGAPPVVVLSDHYWRRVFNADPNVLGRTLSVSGTLTTIVGILPPGFRGLRLSESPDLYVPLHVAGDIEYQVFNGADPLAQVAWIRIVGRVRPGEAPAVTTERLNGLPCMCGRDVTHAESAPLILVNINVAAVPEAFRSGMTQFTTLLSSIVALLLLVGCLTVGMLLLVRTEGRSDELAMRLALGATRSRLVYDIATEAGILCALGAALSVPVAIWLGYGVRAFQLPGRIDLDLLQLGFAPGPWLLVTSIAFAATFAIALLASFLTLGTSARSPYRPRALGTPRVSRRAPRTALIAGQVAITFVLVTGAGLFARSVVEALRLNPAVDTDRLAVASISLPQAEYTPARASAFVDELRGRLQQDGAIHSVSITQTVGRAVAGVRIGVDGTPRELPSGIAYFAVEENYFSTVGLPIVRGRNIARSDTAASAPVAIVSESLGKLIAEGGNPIGHRISDSTSFRQINSGQAGTYLEIVGIVPDLITNVNDTEPLVVYQAVPQKASQLRATSLVLRSSGDMGAAVRDVTATVRALDPQVFLQDLMTLDALINSQMEPQRFGIRVLTTLSGIALFLTGLSTYVAAQSMAMRRRREFCIRAALGARSGHLRRLVLHSTARVVGVGLISGLALVALGARLISSLLYHVEPLDPLVLVAGAAGVFSLALLVTLRAAIEATRTDLSRSLHAE